MRSLSGLKAIVPLQRNKTLAEEKPSDRPRTIGGTPFSPETTTPGRAIVPLRYRGSPD
ncbi:hypothetical protein ZHAS_00010098 [Anopheles sinensis]|uniref:Uncharacterized protein n=1 Tax=Anopheles sinensis TaxID=74873 RepID=A0A084VWQ9_ANOSI|nr:hypothetical protein ZHAS_00010098 [Anopheles sinensis]